MNKKEFLETLGRRLAQVYTREKVMEHIQYYDTYITEKVAQGAREEEVIAQLGDPLLIARTIMDAGEAKEESQNFGTVYEETDHGWSEDRSKHDRGVSGYSFQMNSKSGCLIALIVIVVVLILLVWLLGAVMIRLLPIIVPVLVVLGVISLFKRD